MPGGASFWACTPYAENFRTTADGWTCEAVVTDARLAPTLSRVAERKELVASSGSVGHLVEKHCGLIDLWPVGELGLTLKPSNRHATALPDTTRQRLEVLDRAEALVRRASVARIQPTLDRFGISLAA